MNLQKRTLAFVIILVSIIITQAAVAHAQQLSQEFTRALHWRNIGPFRGGRTRAVAGHPYGPNEERGIFRSTDGGKSFEKVLYKDENTGGADVQIDPTNPETVYASLWEAREGPWENGSWNGTGGGIFKSTDGGKTWNQLTKGLPDGIVQANLAIAPSQSRSLFAAVATTAGVSLY